MEFIDNNKVLKAYDISNVYLPGFVLIPCDKYGDIFLYDCDIIHYTKGNILSYPYNKPLRKIENLSAYYKVCKEDKNNKEIIKEVTRFLYEKFRNNQNKLLPFNEEFTTDEFRIFKEAYEKEWENAIKISEFSFDELKQKGEIKNEIPNLFDD